MKGLTVDEDVSAADVVGWSLLAFKIVSDKHGELCRRVEAEVQELRERVEALEGKGRSIEFCKGVGYHSIEM